MISIKKIQQFLLPYQIGFIRGHYYLNKHQVSQIKKVLNSNDGSDIIAEYEKRMTALIGPGYGISFAAGRMAFYSLLKALDIGEGDEVILPGHTCSVMVNAVWRIGAIPVFTDIDCETFGSNAEEIKKNITPHTKVIVAQHSFGIPCSMPEIVNLGKKQGIFVMEDCALTLDSYINEKKVGNLADAAIFSTDHTKPINTLIGGFLYTQNKSLYEKIKESSETLPQLNKNHQKLLYEQFIFERKNYTPKQYPRASCIGYVRDVIRRNLMSRGSVTFLEADYRKECSVNPSYPYPAKMPPFLAQLGIFELERWNDEKARRKNLLKKYLHVIKNSDFNNYLPKAYHNQILDIVPLRFVFCHPNAEKLIKKMATFIDVKGIWFYQPIICSPDGPESLGYKFGSCPISEEVGKKIINWPCVIPEDWEPKILNAFEKIINIKNWN